MTAEDDTYSTIFTALKHPIRRNILRRLNTSSATYTELLNELEIENGLLTYHLESMRDLLKKKEDGSYTLSEFGKAGLSLIQRVEEPRTEAKSIALKYRRVKVLLVTLLLCFITVSAFYVELNNRYIMSQADSITTDKTLLVNMSLNELTSRIESIAPNSGKLVLPILLNGTLSGVNIPDNVRGYPVIPFSKDYRIYFPPDKLQYYVFTLLEFRSQQASVQILSVENYTTGTPPFGVSLTINYVKTSGAWVISSVEGGVFPEG
jgi:hypothetical protein